jgi:prophage antirepressor-like protein
MRASLLLKFYPFYGNLLRKEDSMNNNMQVFKNEEFGEVRTIERDGEVWFVGKEIAEKLGYQNGSRDINRHTDEEDRRIERIIYSGQKRDAILINESGLYSLILSSKLPSAKKFKRWVTSEVLPALRKHGEYKTDAFEGLSPELKALFVVDKRITAVKDDLEKFKQDLPILGIEESKITNAVRSKGVKTLGGKDSNAYKNKSIRSKVYSDIYSQLKREFGSSSYKAIKRNQCDLAIEIINNYKPPMALANEIKQANAQMTLEV